MESSIWEDQTRDPLQFIAFPNFQLCYILWNKGLTFLE